jgi:hypothetical protein
MFFGGEVHGGCPHAFKKIRIEKIPRADSEPLIIGRDAHKLAGDYISRLVNTEQQTDWDWATGLLTTSTHPDVTEIFTRFYENFVLPPLEAPGIEKKLAFNRAWQPVEWFAKDAFFRAITDFTFLQGTLAVVIDFKTNRAIINIDPEHIPLQLKIYGWAVKQALYPAAQEVLLRLHFMRYGAERETLLTPQDLATVPAELEEKIAIIEAEKHFDPRPGHYCSMCGVQSHCSYMANALVPVEVMAPACQADAVKAAGILLAIKEMEKALTARLKEYVQQFGPVPVGDLIYGPVPGVDYDLDPKTVTEQLLEMNFPADDVWKVLKIGKTSLDSGLKLMGLTGKRSKERKALIERILAGAEQKETETVKFHKAKEV